MDKLLAKLAKQCDLKTLLVDTNVQVHNAVEYRLIRELYLLISGELLIWDILYKESDEICKYDGWVNYRLSDTRFLVDPDSGIDERTVTLHQLVKIINTSGFDSTVKMQKRASYQPNSPYYGQTFPILIRNEDEYPLSDTLLQYLRLVLPDFGCFVDEDREIVETLTTPYCKYILEEKGVEAFFRYAIKSDLPKEDISSILNILDKVKYH